jgi:secreted PhoX family phosphatase
MSSVGVSFISITLNMKGSLHPRNNATINPSRNESILDVIARAGMGRRRFLRTAASTALLTAMGENFLRQGATAVPISPSPGFAGIGFESIPPNTAVLDAQGKIVTPVADRVNVAAGYNVEVLASWGDPITRGAPGWAPNVSQDAGAQEQQFGMHNDGMHYFPLSWTAVYQP